MNADASKIFASHEDYLNWNKYIAYCDVMAGLTSVERKDAKESLECLRGLYGENFLHRAFNQRERKHPHPLVQLIMQQAPWSRFWLIRFAKALRAVEGAENFKGLLKRVKDAEKFAEGESVLEAAFQLYSAGFKVSFDPEVPVTDRDGNQSMKKPDLKVVDRETGEEVIVEVSLLTRSAGWRRSEEITSFIIPLLFGHLSPARLTMYARMSENFDETRVEETVAELKALIEEVKSTGEFRALVNDCIEAGIAPQDREEPLKHWAAERGVEPGIAGPPVYSNEMARAVMKIRDKLAQLPDDLPGIIVIPTTGSTLFHRYPLNSIVEVLSAEVSRYPKVLCIVLSHGYFGGEGGEPFSVTFEQHAVVSRNVGGALNEQSLVLLNPGCTAPVSHTLLRKIHNAFIQT